MKRKELPPIRESKEDYDGIEKEILRIFRQVIYYPLLRELGRQQKTLKNAKHDLAGAIASGQVRYYRGRFSGRFDAGISRELRDLGAVWDRTQGSWNLPHSKLPESLRSAIQVSEYRFDRTTEAIDRRLAQILPKQIAENVKIARFFDRTLYRIDKDFESQIRGITIVPKLTPETRAKVAAGYTKDLQKYIEDFTEKEIGRLRKDVSESFLAGNRYENLVDKIQASYGVSQNKAKFLARQETALMMTSFKTARYQEAGINRYKWQCVVGSPKHPVRPMHKALDGKEFSFDRPPITDEKGNRNNPGSDFNCRCIARPIVKF